MILSARGSMSMPKFVIRLRRRAISPSRRSVTPPAMKSTKAMVSWYRTFENITTRKATVKRKRETVSLFGRFISLAAPRRVKCVWSFRLTVLVAGLRALANPQLKLPVQAAAVQKPRQRSSRRKGVLPNAMTRRAELLEALDSVRFAGAVRASCNSALRKMRFRLLGQHALPSAATSV